MPRMVANWTAATTTLRRRGARDGGRCARVAHVLEHGSGHATEPPLDEPADALQGRNAQDRKTDQHTPPGSPPGRTRALRRADRPTRTPERQRRLR